MGAAKWIGGVLGFMAGGPLGALAGFVLGKVFDKSFETPETDSKSNDYHGGYSAQERSSAGQRNSFLFSMLVMASYIIKADGKVMHSEMECVRRFLRNSFGADAESQGEQILLRLFEQRKKMDMYNPNAFRNTIKECGAQIADNLSYEERIQLLEFLVEIVKADGKIVPEEVAALKEVALAMLLSVKEVESLLSMRSDSLEDAYKVLEITPDATNEEVRAAYRRMALKHHPDKVASLGEDIRKAAEEKFQEINNAKDKIYKARGLN